jgi:hypothetical protein
VAVSDDIRDEFCLDSRAGYAIDRLTAMQYALARGAHMDALRTADSFAAIFSELLADVAQAAYDAGETKAAIARALGVSPATFRGMVRR